MAQNFSPIVDDRPTILRSKVVYDRSFHWLSVDNEALILEKIENEGSPKKRSRPPIRIPLSEVLAVKFSDWDDDRRKNNGCATCCTSENKPKRPRGKDRRSLTSKNVISHLLNGPSRLLKKEATATDASLVGSEVETEGLVVYFIERKPNHVWRLGQIVCHFNVSVGKNLEEALPTVAAAEFLKAIRRRIAEYERPRRLLVFVNPFGGKKRAQYLYKDIAVSVFDLCDIVTTVIETKRPDHAKDFVSQENISSFDGIITTGGDGLFNEVLNGLVTRKQKLLEININDRKTELAKPDIPVGVIAAGSTNALAYTLHGTDDVLTSVLHIAIGDRRGIDVCGIYDQEKFLRFACTAVSYGFLGDVLKESERLRRFGPPRYVMSGVKVWLRNSHYGGIIHYKTRFGAKHDGNAKTLKLKPCRSNCNLCAEDDPSGEAALKRQLSTTTVSGDEDSDRSWSIEDDFTHLVGVVTPCLCNMAPDGISPDCHLGDGTMHLVLVSRIGRFKNLAILGRIMSKNTNHTRASMFRVFEVKEFSFTPASLMKPTFTRSSSDVIKTTGSEDGQSKKDVAIKKADCLGGWNTDGELMPQPEGIIYFRVHRQLITLFARGIETSSQ